METQTLLSLTALGLVIFWVGDYFYKHLTFWQRQGIPARPYIQLGWSKEPFFKFAQDNAKYFAPKKIYGLYGVGNKTLVVNDARVARELSTKELHKFPIRNTKLNQGRTNIRKSLFFMEANEDWKRIRSIVTPAFTSGKLKRMLTPIERIAANFVEHLRVEARSGGTFDLKKYIGGFAMDVIASCAYGIEIDSVSQPDHPVVVNAKSILNVDISFSQLICFLFPKIGKLLNLEVFDRDAINYFDKLTFEIVEKRMKQREGGKQKPDFLGLMIEESQNATENSKGISRDEMSGQGILFFIAGFDTTHATFDHVVYYLTQYPEWQERLYEELDASRDDLDYEKIKELPILNAVINETLRLKPPLVMFQREAKEDCELLDTGIKVPKNTIISIRPCVIHHDPDYFPDPEAFKPERFLDKATSAESSFAFMPFGAGPRLCVGMRFAQNELRIGLANFFLNYRVSAEPGMQLEYFKGSPLMAPKKLMVSIEERPL